jgi:guanylate kinase
MGDLSTEEHAKSASSRSPEGKLVVFAAPSGAGKTTIVQYLLEQMDQLAFSVSATSRKAREGEVDGKDYYFLTAESFRQKISEGAFLEWEEVYPGMFYGTLFSELDRLWEAGKHIIFDIDVKGALNIKRHFPERTLTVFVKPPNLEVLRERLQKRDTETHTSLQIRLDKATEELSFANQFDSILVNKKLTVALQEARERVEQFLEPA